MKLKDAVNRTTMRKVERENGELKEKLDTLGKQLEKLEKQKENDKLYLLRQEELILQLQQEALLQQPTTEAEKLQKMTAKAQEEHSVAESFGAKMSAVAGETTQLKDALGGKLELMASLHERSEADKVNVTQYLMEVLAMLDKGLELKDKEAEALRTGFDMENARVVKENDELREMVDTLKSERVGNQK